MESVPTDMVTSPVPEIIHADTSLEDAILDFLFDEPQPLGVVIDHVRATCPVTQTGPLNDTVGCLDSLVRNESVVVRQGLLCMTIAARRRWESTHAAAPA